MIDGLMIFSSGTHQYGQSDGEAKRKVILKEESSDQFRYIFKGRIIPKTTTNARIDKSFFQITHTHTHRGILES